MKTFAHIGVSVYCMAFAIFLLFYCDRIFTLDPEAKGFVQMPLATVVNLFAGAAAVGQYLRSIRNTSAFGQVLFILSFMAILTMLDFWIFSMKL